jgi:hypothetical protein
MTVEAVEKLMEESAEAQQMAEVFSPLNDFDFERRIRPLISINLVKLGNRSTHSRELDGARRRRGPRRISRNRTDGSRSFALAHARGAL